jgi:hypothetical protein
MRKRTWTWVEVGIAVVGLCLVCGAVQDVARPQDTNDPYGVPTGTTGTEQGTGGAGQETGGSGQGTGQATETGQGQGTSVEAAQRQEISLLRAEVERLQQELTRMRAQTAEAGRTAQGGSGTGTGGTGNVGTGTGGAENAGVGDPNAEAPSGQAGLGDAAGEGVGGGGRAGGAQQAARPDTDNQGTAVANVIYTGRVRSVSQGQLVLDIEGGISNSLLLARDVRVFRGREQVSLQSLREGTVVRASADLYARGNPVTRIEVLTSSSKQAPRK